MDKWEDNRDLGMKPAHGLPPPKLSVKECITADKGNSDNSLTMVTLRLLYNACLHLRFLAVIFFF